MKIIPCFDGLEKQANIMPKSVLQTRSTLFILNAGVFNIIQNGNHLLYISKTCVLFRVPLTQNLSFVGRPVFHRDVGFVAALHTGRLFLFKFLLACQTDNFFTPLPDISIQAESGLQCIALDQGYLCVRNSSGMVDRYLISNRDLLLKNTIFSHKCKFIDSYGQTLVIQLVDVLLVYKNHVLHNTIKQQFRPLLLQGLLTSQDNVYYCFALDKNYPNRSETMYLTEFGITMNPQILKEIIFSSPESVQDFDIIGKHFIQNPFKCTNATQIYAFMQAISRKRSAGCQLLHDFLKQFPYSFLFSKGQFIPMETISNLSEYFVTEQLKLFQEQMKANYQIEFMVNDFLVPPTIEQGKDIVLPVPNSLTQKAEQLPLNNSLQKNDFPQQQNQINYLQQELQKLRIQNEYDNQQTQLQQELQNQVPVQKPGILNYQIPKAKLQQLQYPMPISNMPYQVKPQYQVVQPSSSQQVYNPYQDQQVNNNTQYLNELVLQKKSFMQYQIQEQSSVIQPRQVTMPLSKPQVVDSKFQISNQPQQNYQLSSSQNQNIQMIKQGRLPTSSNLIPSASTNEISAQIKQESNNDKQVDSLQKLIENVVDKQISQNISQPAITLQVPPKYISKLDKTTFLNQSDPLLLQTVVHKNLQQFSHTQKILSEVIGQQPQRYMSALPQQYPPDLYVNREQKAKNTTKQQKPIPTVKVQSILDDALKRILERREIQQKEKEQNLLTLKSSKLTQQQRQKNEPVKVGLQLKQKVEKIQQVVIPLPPEDLSDMESSIQFKHMQLLRTPEFVVQPFVIDPPDFDQYISQQSMTEKGSSVLLESDPAQLTITNDDVEMKAFYDVIRVEQLALKYSVNIMRNATNILGEEVKVVTEVQDRIDQAFKRIFGILSGGVV